MATPKTKENIKLTNWLTIQQQATSGNQLGDNEPSDDLGGPGPHLVFENGIWKYPQQDSCGRFDIATSSIRIMYVMADFGSSTDWEIHVAGIDSTAARPLNTSGEPYDSGDAALYQEKDIPVASGTNQQLALDFASAAVEAPSIVLKGQHVYVTTSAGTEPLIRITFQPLYDTRW